MALERFFGNWKDQFGVGGALITPLSYSLFKVLDNRKAKKLSFDNCPKFENSSVRIRFISADVRKVKECLIELEKTEEIYLGKQLCIIEKIPLSKGVGYPYREGRTI